MRSLLSILTILLLVACSDKPNIHIDSSDWISNASLILLCEQTEEDGKNYYRPIELIKGVHFTPIVNEHGILRSYTTREPDVRYTDKVLIFFDNDKEEIGGYRRFGIIPVENDSIKSKPTDPTNEERINLDTIRQNKATHTTSANARLFSTEPLEINDLSHGTQA